MPTAVALPAQVKGAHLRPVGDPRRGYGSRTARATMQRLQKLGVNTVGVLVEARLAHPQDVNLRLPDRAALDATRAALLDANAQGLATVLIPHLYLDSGEWRGRLAPSDLNVWWSNYFNFIEAMAELAQATGTSALSLGVELKSLSAKPETRARMFELAARIRRIYRGPLTYSANWDEAEDVAFWDGLELIGVNGYYPLKPDPVRGAESVARRLSALSAKFNRPVLILEAGYRASPLSHERPWEWPEDIEPLVDEVAQAQAWAAVLESWMPAPGVRGVLIWVVPTDPDDPASEPRHGFNPLNKAAEAVIARAFGVVTP